MIKKIPLEHRIILLLNEQCDLSLVEISKTVSTCRQTVSRKIKRLTEYGLIDVEHCKGPPPKYLISLTDRGRQTRRWLQHRKGRTLRGTWPSDPHPDSEASSGFSHRIRGPEEGARHREQRADAAPSEEVAGLVKVADGGNHALTDEGRGALRVALAMEGDRPARRLRVTLSPALVVCILLVCSIAAVASISYLENASMRGALDAADQEMAQLNQSYTQLLSDMEHFNSQVDQQSPFLTRISKSQAIRIALAYGGWNASSLRGQTVAGTLYHVTCNTSSNWRARTNVTEPAASYSPINDGEMEYFYEWYITIAGNFGNGPFQLCHAGYYIDAMNGQILGMMVADINWIL